MKKYLLIASLVGLNALVHATTINAPSSLIGTGALSGSDAYSWGISIAVPNGQTVTSAQISFTSITLTAGNGTGIDNLYVDLLNSKTPGLTTVAESGVNSDYWTTQFSGANITSLGVETFTALNKPLTWSFIFSGSQLAALNSYLAAGTFNIGLDPDCHYNVGGISFSYTLGTGKTNNVPDEALTAFLVVISLGGLEIFRRQFATAKIKA